MVSAAGVVTSFTYRTHPQPPVVLGLSCFLELSVENIQSYFDLLPIVPDQWGFTAVLAHLALPLGITESTLLVEGIYFGDWASGMPSVEPFILKHPGCSLTNWTGLSWWTNMLEGGEGCKIVQTGRVYSTSILSRREHLSAANGTNAVAEAE